MAGTRKDKLTQYPEAFGEAYQTLGIVLGAPDFEGKMGLLKEMVASPLDIPDKLEIFLHTGATPEAVEALEMILTYYENQKSEKR